MTGAPPRGGEGARATPTKFVGPLWARMSYVGNNFDKGEDK